MPAALKAVLQDTKLWPYFQAMGYVPRSFGVAPQVAQGGSTGSTSSAGYVSTGPTVTPPAVVTDVATNGLSGFTGSLNVLATSAARPSYRPVAGSSTTAAASDGSLLLVDQAWADFDADSSDDADDDSLVGCAHDDDDESLSDLALAAVLEDESNWWEAI